MIVVKRQMILVINNFEKMTARMHVHRHLYDKISLCSGRQESGHQMTPGKIAAKIDITKKAA